MSAKAIIAAKSSKHAGSECLPWNIRFETFDQAPET